MTDEGKKVDPEKSYSISETFWDTLQSIQRRLLNRKTLYKRLPILRWLPRYSSEDGICDLVAGISVGLTVIPQAIAYAAIAGLPAEVSVFVYLIPISIVCNLFMFLVWTLCVLSRLLCLHIPGQLQGRTCGTISYNCTANLSSSSRLCAEVGIALPFMWHCGVTNGYL